MNKTKYNYRAYLKEKTVMSDEIYAAMMYQFGYEYLNDRKHGLAYGKGYETHKSFWNWWNVMFAKWEKNFVTNLQKGNAIPLGPLCAEMFERSIARTLHKVAHTNDSFLSLEKNLFKKQVKERKTAHPRQRRLGKIKPAFQGRLN